MSVKHNAWRGAGARARELALEALEDRWVLSTFSEPIVDFEPAAFEGLEQISCCEQTLAADQVSAGPTAEDDWATMPPATPVRVPVLDNDVDPDGELLPETVQVVDGPVKGTVDVDPETGDVIYTANHLFDGVDSFRYTVEDNDGNVSNEAEVTVVCWTNPENRLDVTGDRFLSPSDVLCIVNYINTHRGDGSLPDPPATPPNFCDVSGNGVIAPLDALIVVNALNNNPVPATQPDWAVTLPGQPVLIPVLANDSGPSGLLAPSSVTIVVEPEAGAVEVDLNTGDCTYAPGDAFDGSDTFAYTVQDIVGRTSPVTLVTVVTWQNPVNPLDVDGKNDVTEADALCLLNFLNAHPGDNALPAPPAVPPPFYDVDGDMLVTSTDLLCVLNALETMEPTLAEGDVGHSEEQLGALDAFMEQLGDGQLLDPVADLNEQLLFAI